MPEHNPTPSQLIKNLSLVRGVTDVTGKSTASLQNKIEGDIRQEARKQNKQQKAGK